MQASARLSTMVPVSPGRVENCTKPFFEKMRIFCTPGWAAIERMISIRCSRSVRSMLVRVDWKMMPAMRCSDMTAVVSRFSRSTYRLAQPRPTSTASRLATSPKISFALRLRIRRVARLLAVCGVVENRKVPRSEPEQVQPDDHDAHCNRYLHPGRKVMYPG